MKKKSLLLAIAAMSMAAVGVGTVGTFAWYQASFSLGAAKSAGIQTITTATTAATITDSELPVQVTVGTAEHLELAFSPEAGQLKTGYIDQNKKFYPLDAAVDSTNNTLWKPLSVNVQALGGTDSKGTTWTKSDAAASLNGSHIDVIFEAAIFVGQSDKSFDGNEVYYVVNNGLYTVKEGITTENWDANKASLYAKSTVDQRARFFKDTAVTPDFTDSSKLAVADDIIDNNDNVNSITLSNLQVNGDTLNSDGHTYYVGIYVYGGTHADSGSTKDTAAVQAGIIVTVQKH